MCNSASHLRDISLIQGGKACGCTFSSPYSYLHVHGLATNHAVFLPALSPLLVTAFHVMLVRKVSRSSRVTSGTRCLIKLHDRLCSSSNNTSQWRKGTGGRPISRSGHSCNDGSRGTCCALSCLVSSIRSCTSSGNRNMASWYPW